MPNCYKRMGNTTGQGGVGVAFPEQVLEVFKNLGWEIYRNEDPDVEWTPERGFILEGRTSSGTQEFIVVTEDNIVRELWDAYQKFDKEKYVLDRMGQSLTSVDVIREYQKDAREIKERYWYLYWGVYDALMLPCTMTIWVNEKMIPMEVIRMIEVLKSTIDSWFPIFDGVNGTVIYERTTLSIATRLAKMLDKEFRLCPVEYEIEMLPIDNEEDEE